MKKYTLTKNKKVVHGVTLFQIKAEMSFADVKKGDLGGWIEKEHNLSQENNAWVYDSAIVCCNAKVYGNAKVYDSAIVYGAARVRGNAKVYGSAIVYGAAVVCGDAMVCGNAIVYGDARVCGKLKILSGLFFGTRFNKEEIRFIESGEQEVIYKGDAKFGMSEENKKQELINKTDELIKKIKIKIK